MPCTHQLCFHPVPGNADPVLETKGSVPWQRRQATALSAPGLDDGRQLRGSKPCSRTAPFGWPLTRRNPPVRGRATLPRRLKVRLRTLTPSIEVRILTGHPPYPCLFGTHRACHAGVCQASGASFTPRYTDALEAFPQTGPISAHRVPPKHWPKPVQADAAQQAIVRGRG